MNKIHRYTTRGFTLIEVLVSISIFSLVILSLISIQTQTLNNNNNLSNYFFASIIAENQLIKSFRPGSSVLDNIDKGTVSMVGKTWNWNKDIIPTDNPLVVKLNVDVWLSNQKDIIYSLYSYRGGE